MKPRTYFEDIGLWPTGGNEVVRMYVIGYVLSLALTFGAYYLTPAFASSPTRFILVAFAFALTQFAVQIVCFLHMSTDLRSRGRILTFASIVLIVGILVTGSIWIMRHLDERMMASPTLMEEYMTNQTGI